MDASSPIEAAELAVSTKRPVHPAEPDDGAALRIHGGLACDPRRGCKSIRSSDRLPVCPWSHCSFGCPRLFPRPCYTYRLLIMHIVLLIICAGLFLSLFQSTRDGLLWLIAGLLFLGIASLVFPFSP